MGLCLYIVHLNCICLYYNILSCSYLYSERGEINKTRQISSSQWLQWPATKSHCLTCWCDGALSTLILWSVNLKTTDKLIMENNSNILKGFAKTSNIHRDLTVNLRQLCWSLFHFSTVKLNQNYQMQVEKISSICMEHEQWHNWYNL